MSAATLEMVPQGLRPGPKSARCLDPLDLTEAPPADWRRVEWFAKNFLTVPSGHGARKPFKVRPWQRDILKALFPGKGARPSQGLLSMPRANGKSTLSAVLAAYALYADDRESPQVLCVASDARQAGIVFNCVRRMVELNPELASRTKVYGDKLVVPGNNGLLMPLPSDIGALQGWAPSLAVVDELHTVSAEVWESMIGASGKVPNSLCLAISTPALSEESVMWSLVRDAREQPRADFFFREWTSDNSHPVDCEHCVRASNPAFGDFLTAASMTNVRTTMRESAYRRLRLGQWLDTVEDQWISRSTWRECSTGQPIEDGARVILAVDGSFSGDATAVVAVSIEEEPHADLVALWEPHAQPEGYRVPISAVEEVLRAACGRWAVEEVVFDPFRWARTMQALAAEGLPVVEFPQSIGRMAPATAGVYEALTNSRLSHSGNADLERHVLAARVTETERGTKLRKASKNSEEKIDAAVCLVMAHARAVFHATKKTKRRKVLSFK